MLQVACSQLFDNWVTPWGLVSVIAFGPILPFGGAEAMSLLEYVLMAKT
jgi:hypothetical protein